MKYITFCCCIAFIAASCWCSCSSSSSHLPPPLSSSSSSPKSFFDPPTFDNNNNDSSSLVRESTVRYILDTYSPVFVLFYSSNSTECPTCADVAKEWSHFARDVDGIVVVGALNVDKVRRKIPTKCEDPNMKRPLVVDDEYYTYDSNNHNIRGEGAEDIVLHSILDDPAIKKRRFSKNNDKLFGADGEECVEFSKPVIKYWPCGNGFAQKRSRRASRTYNYDDSSNNNNNNNNNNKDNNKNAEQQQKKNNFFFFNRSALAKFALSLIPGDKIAVATSKEAIETAMDEDLSDRACVLFLSSPSSSSSLSVTAAIVIPPYFKLISQLPLAKSSHTLNEDGICVHMVVPSHYRQKVASGMQIGGAGGNGGDNSDLLVIFTSASSSSVANKQPKVYAGRPGNVLEILRFMHFHLVRPTVFEPTNTRDTNDGVEGGDITNEVEAQEEDGNTGSSSASSSSRSKNKKKTKELLPVHQCATLRECFSDPKRVVSPFIVRDDVSFHDASSSNSGDTQQQQQQTEKEKEGEDKKIKESFERAKNNLLNKSMPFANELVYGKTVCDTHIFYKMHELMQKWLDNKIETNTFDAYFEFVPLPDVFKEFEQTKENPQKIGPVLTPQGGYTMAHYDPVRGVEGGGIWMHLFTGRKIFQFMHPRAIFELQCKRQCQRDVQPYELQASDVDAAATSANTRIPPAPSSSNGAGGGEDDYMAVWQVELRAGDTLYWPPGWVHRVFTEEKALGAGGYVTLPGVEEIQKVALEQEAMVAKYGGSAVHY